MDEKRDNTDKSLNDKLSDKTPSSDTDDNLDSVEGNTSDNSNSSPNKKPNLIKNLKSFKFNYNYSHLYQPIILLALIILIIVSIVGLKNDSTMIKQNMTITTWEYKVIYLESSEIITYIKSDLNPSEVQLTEDMINTYGVEGWELVDSYLEMETVHPNYGNEEYVTGLQPNVRPQRLVLIFKKPL